MIKLKVVETYRCDSEEEAKNEMENFRQEQNEGRFTIGKMGYTYKIKKSKGEIIDEAWVLDITKIFGGIWDGIE